MNEGSSFDSGGSPRPRLSTNLKYLPAQRIHAGRLGALLQHTRRYPAP
jgi:hypothetical protein